MTRNAMRDKIDLLKKETETTIRTLYALQEFNFLLGDQSSIDKINNNPEFWKLNELAKLVRKYSKKMKRKYIKAASEIYAHAIHTDNESAKVILRELNFEEMEDALNALWHVYDQVWKMYENGSKPSFVVSGYPYADEIQNCICNQL